MATTTLTFDWVSPEFLADPYIHYKRLRDETPIFYNEVRGSWVLTRYNDMVGVLRDHDRFSAERDFRPQDDRAEDDRPGGDGYGNSGSGNGFRTMLSSDPPDHTRLRNLVNKAFTARTVERLRQRIHEITDRLLDEIADRGEMEVIRDFAYPLPITVIAEMLGVPADDRDFFRDQSQKIAVALGPIDDMEVAAAAGQGAFQLATYFNQLIDKRKGEDTDDLISALLAVEDDGDTLSHGELIGMLILLLVAGHETTVNLIGNGLLALLRNPDQLDRMRNEEGIERTGVEEFLRYDSPVQFTGRGTLEDVEIAGQHIPAGSAVTTILGAANRDPEVFENSDSLDLGRDPCPHLSFSAGIHYCLGAQLARLEGSIALSTVVRRFPKLALATEHLEWRPAPILRGLATFPVTF
jgi:pimeloyl-[acyl-carrier protein] synthase